MIIVLDTETCGGFAEPLVYDLGYIIADEETGEVVKMRSYIIKETFDNKALFETAYYHEKRPMYEERLKSGYSKKVWFAYAMRQLLADIQKYGVNKFAYNSAFDNRAIAFTMAHFNKIKYNPIEKRIIDIMDFIAPITNTEEYIAFCEKYGFMTKHKKPRPQKKAETLYRYLMNNPNYNEEHTALEDSKIELFILQMAWRKGE